MGVPSARPVPADFPAVDLEADFEQVFRDYAPRIARWLSRLGVGMDLDDLVQDVFLVIHRRLPEFRGDAQMSTWIFRIVENIYRNWTRRQRVRRILSLGLGDEEEGEEVLIDRSGLTPVEALEKKQLAYTFYKVLDQLPPKYRIVLVLFELEGLGIDEIAQMMDAKPATLRVWLHRARSQFATRFPTAALGFRRDDGQP